MFVKSLREDGYITITAPNSCDLLIPSFTYEWIIWICEHVECSGDLKTAEKYFEIIKKVIWMHIDKMADGLLKNTCGEAYWHFYDWADGLDGTNPDKEEFSIDFYEEFDAVSNLLFYMLNRVFVVLRMRDYLYRTARILL